MGRCRLLDPPITRTAEARRQLSTGRLMLAERYDRGDMAADKCGERLSVLKEDQR
jgi:hypothetical protein